jgi:hypothetical protein
MKKLFILIVLSIFLYPCEKALASRCIDQCLRSNLFEKCLKIIPQGPKTTKYNDWDEVVDSCSSQSYYSAIRECDFVKPECSIKL